MCRGNKIFLSRVVEITWELLTELLLTGDCGERQFSDWKWLPASLVEGRNLIY